MIKMKVKIKLLITVTTLVSLILAGCFNGQQGDNKNGDTDKSVIETKDLKSKKYSNRFSFKEHGFQFYINDTWRKYLDDGLMYMMDIEYPTDFPFKFITLDDQEKEKWNKSTGEFQKYEKDLFIIKIVDKNNDVTKSNVDEISKKYAKKQKLGTCGNFEYYIWYNDKFDTSALSDKSKKQVNDILEGMDFLLKNIEIFNPIDTEMELEKLKVFEFKGKTIDGKDIDNSIFKDHKVTIIDFWVATNSSETHLYNIQQFYKDNKDKDVNVIGIILNGDEDKEKAKAILNYYHVTFTNIILDKKYLDKIDKTLVVTPMRIFVDNKGSIIGQGMVREDYKEELEKRIEKVK